MEANIRCGLHQPLYILPGQLTGAAIGHQVCIAEVGQRFQNANYWGDFLYGHARQIHRLGVLTVLHATEADGVGDFHIGIGCPECLNLGIFQSRPRQMQGFQIGQVNQVCAQHREGYPLTGNGNVL